MRRWGEPQLVVMNTIPPRTPITVGLLLFPNVEPLDFAGPFQVFAAARESDESENRLCRIVTLAESTGPILSRYGLKLLPDHDLENHPPLDILIIPGGKGVPSLRDRSVVLDWIAAQHNRVHLTLSVCTGVFLLAQIGLLDELEATTHHASIDRLRREFPRIRVLDNVRWCQTGKIITSAGVSAGIDASFFALEYLFGPEVAAATARGIEYHQWLERPLPKHGG